jgi:membrane-anchored protein YejM (alkaline phosphatase superfamily)
VRKQRRRYGQHSIHAVPLAGPIDSLALAVPAGYKNSSCPEFGIDQPMVPALARKHRRAYFASLSYTDALIGNVIAALDSTPLVDDTVVVLWYVRHLPTY